MKLINKKVEAIVYFPDENIDEPRRPVVPEPKRIQYINKNKENIVVRVDKIIEKHEEKILGMPTVRYVCESFVEQDGALNQIRYELLYDINKCQWVLYKI